MVWIVTVVSVMLVMGVVSMMLVVFVRHMDMMTVRHVKMWYVNVVPVRNVNVVPVRNMNMWTVTMMNVPSATPSTPTPFVTIANSKIFDLCWLRLVIAILGILLIGPFLLNLLCCILCDRCKKPSSFDAKSGEQCHSKLEFDVKPKDSSIDLKCAEVGPDKTLC